MLLNAMDSIPCYLLGLKISVKDTNINEPNFRNPFKYNSVQRLRCFLILGKAQYTEESYQYKRKFTNILVKTHCPL